MNIKLSIADVKKSFDKRPVLTGCTQSFAGGVTAIMGPNGCGKTTLLRICALLEEPTSGRVSYFYTTDRSLRKDKALMRKITLVLPSGGIFDTTVWKNVTYGLRLRRKKGRDIRKRTTEILKTVGLYEKRKQNALSLSSGEAQRLALARAMVLEPQALLLDEPTASVDDANTKVIEKLILGMKKPGGPTIIIATHDRDQAERLADRILVMKQGKIAFAGNTTSEELDKKENLPPEEGGFYINPQFS